MRVRFDQNAPRPLARFLIEHVVTRATQLDWQELKNGELILAAEAHGFEVLVTSDKNLRYQQNLADRTLAIVVLPSGQWPKIEPYVPEIVIAVDQARPGSFQEILPAQSSPKPDQPKS